MAAVEKLITENLDIWSSAIKAKSAAGRGTSKKLELYGIKKLRELILELAVHGLLVPQESNDEPASEFMKIIEAEKAKLIKVGSIKKQKKPISPFSEAEELFKVPENWSWQRLGDIGEIFTGNSINASVKERKYTNNSGIPFIATKDVGYGFEGLDYKNGVSIPAGEDKFKIAKKGSVLICAEGGSAGKKCGIAEKDIYFGNKLFANVLYGSIEPKYILSLFLSPSFFVRLTESMTGIIGGISRAKFMALPVPIPPLKEQHRIVAKVDELMALCDQLEQQTETSISAHQTLVQTLLETLTKTSEIDGFNQAWARIAEHFDTLFSTEWSIEQLKQTILQLAVMGKLVPQNPSDEPATELLKKIVGEKSKLIKEGKIKKQKPLSPIGEDQKPFDLPKRWAWVATGEMGEIKLGRQRSPKDHVGPYMIPYLRVANVHDNRIDISDVKEMNFTPGEQVIFRLNHGDILLNEGQSKELVGRPAIYRNEVLGACFQNTLLRFRAWNGIVAEYALLYFRNCLYSGRFQKAVKQTTNMAHLSAGRLIPIEFPLPPTNEQHRIVTKVEQLMTLCDTLKSQLNEANTTQHHLADAIVEQAVT